MNLTIGYLYGNIMNIYGDTGNIITLKKRAEWRSINVEIKEISIDDKINLGQIDLFFFGGGQDEAQEIVSKDIILDTKGKIIKQEIERGVPLLAICGGYQLLGDYYQPHQGPKLEGLGLFPAYTVASYDRMIGNILVKATDQLLQSADLKQLKSDNPHLCDDYLLVGFENHSGKTYLKEGAVPLGKVVKGFGNNGGDQTEGCIYKNAVGCYMHGSLLPKNPQLADWFLKTALEVKYQKEIILKSLNDNLENKAHLSVIDRLT